MGDLSVAIIDTTSSTNTISPADPTVKLPHCYNGLLVINGLFARRQRELRMYHRRQVRQCGELEGSRADNASRARKAESGNWRRQKMELSNTKVLRCPD